MPVINSIAAFADDMTAWRRHLHQIPELGQNCPETAAYVVERLREFGVDEIHEGIAITGVVALINGQGIIDADYYDNLENEGHIMLAIINHGTASVVVEKGMRLAQGIFYKYLTIDGDAAGEGKERQGGMGSTGV